MDKETLSNYGWVVIVLIILSILITMATPFGKTIRDSISGSTNTLKDNALGQMDDVLNEKYYTSHTQSDIDASGGGLIAIGKSNPLYVTASFSDKSVVKITKNGADSDGIMNDFPAGFLAGINGLGDVNSDGIVNMDDKDLIANYMWDKTIEVDTAAADLDNSGTIDSADGVKLAQLLSWRIEPVKKIIVRKGVTAIGDRAFAGFVNLTTVNFANTVTSIGTDVFDGCTSLTTINFQAASAPEGFVAPDGVTVNFNVK